MTSRVAAPQVKGWCPGAYRPMQSGDGMILRVRPYQAHLSRDQITLICDLSDEFGNGLLEVTSRANLQLRGLRAKDHGKVLEKLLTSGLLDADPKVETRRNILVDPFWKPGDLTTRLHTALVAGLPDFPKLPDKAGFAVDCGAEALLAGASADIRLERDAAGGLLLRAEGAVTGLPVSEPQAVEAALTLARWYAARVCGGHGRLRDIVASGTLPKEWQRVAPRDATTPPGPQETPRGQIVGLPFGQLTSPAFRALAAHATSVRLTPWRVILVEGAQALRHPGLITDPADPLLRVDACPGAPRCASAHFDTHALARRLAPTVPGHLHISGCAKGCARRAPADLTVIGTDQGFDIVRHGNTSAAPDRTNLAESDLLAGIS